VPAVGRYAGYGDFASYRLAVKAVRWVGGFGAMDWVEADAYRAATVDPVLPRRHGIIAHMNADHADAGVLLCRRALGVEVESASFEHVDRFGCDYLAHTADGLATVRLAFPAPAASGDDVRRALVAMVHEARAS
jgi:putative heme iron utilization protein